MTLVSQRLLERLPRRWQRNLGSLRTWLIFWNVVALSLLLGVLGVVSRYTTLSFLMRSVDQELERGIRMFQRRPPGGPPFERERGGPPGQNGMGPGPNGFGPARNGPGDERRRPRPPDADNPYRPHIYEADGTSEMPNDTRPVWDEAALKQSLAGEIVRKTIRIDGEPFRLLSSPKPDRFGGTGAVQNVYPLKEVYRALAGVDTALLLLIPVGLLGAGWMGAALTTRILRRVHWMTQAAGRLGAEDLSRRLPVSGSDEFSELAETFNGLLGRLDTAFQQQERLLEQQRRFTADASHELKSPLTIIKGTAGMALSGNRDEADYRRSLQDIERAADTMSHLVQDLLLLARSDSGQLGRNPILLPLSDVLKRAISGVSPVGAPITLELEDEALCVMGNEAELVRLFSNLLENAVHYTPPEGAIRVTARAEGASVLVSISDTGIGIALEHLPHLGERFYRVDTARSRPDGGTGLGLSICKSIVEAHGGAMTFESAPGEGTKVHISLPRP